MFEILNRYCHGLASIPVFRALREAGCLSRLADGEPRSAGELAREFGGNSAYVEVALRMLLGVGWVRSAPGDRYVAAPGLADADAIPPRIMELYRFPFDRYVQGTPENALDSWLTLSEQGWNISHPFLPDYLDGLLVVPLLLSLRVQNRLAFSNEKHAGVVATLRVDADREVRTAIERLFVAHRWADRVRGRLHLNQAGRFVVETIPMAAAVWSYRPMFERARELLFGDAVVVFARDASGHETHVNRTVNVIGSGFQHQTYFAALADQVVRCFDGDSYASQPAYIVDTGCGDGSLLRRLHGTVAARTSRGNALAAHPLIPVAVDFNEEALAEASRTLEGIGHLALQGDTRNPRAIVETLRAHGAEDLQRVLHVRSFLDHNRPHVPPEDRAAAERRSRARVGVGVCIGDDGCMIPVGDVIQSTVEHLRRWAQIVTEHGLVMLEVHSLPPDVTARHLDESESFHFDACHAMSHQCLLDAPTFLACAAEAALFCREGGWLRFPQHLPFTRITLNHFERRPYVVRRAEDHERVSLARLDDVWPRAGVWRDEVIGGSPIEWDDSPEPPFVLELDGRVLAGVHCVRDGTVRLASAVIYPGAPATALRDLLRFVEQYWALGGVARLVGLEQCQSALNAFEGNTSIARAVADDVRARVGNQAFTADDPRAAERELATFSCRWVLATFQRAGVMQRAGESHDLDALERELGVAPKYHRYFSALMRLLQAEGVVTVREGRLETTPLVRDYPLTSVEAQVAEFTEDFQRRHPAGTGLMSLTVRCLRRYHEIINGRIDITDVVFADGDMDAFAAMFHGDVVSDYFNRIVADAVRDAAVRLRATVPQIRILEIGAGTGATTAAVLEALQPISAGVTFCFSDISHSFLRHARRRFADRYPWVDYRPLDIEANLERQGFEAEQFDVIVAANSLHDTRDIEVTLGQTRRLLKRGGLLVLNEYTAAKQCLMFNGALLHGAWLFEDPERRLSDSWLMSVPQWDAALGHAGFSLVDSFGLPTQRHLSERGQSVMLCEAQEIAEVVRQPHAEAPLHEAAKPSPLSGEPLEALVRRHALALLGETRSGAYSDRRPLMDMGLDSIELGELRLLLEGSLGVKLSPALLFEHETPAKLASALSKAAPGRETERPLAQGPRAIGAASDRHSAADDAIAIVGAACRFPGGSDSPMRFWELLASGRCAIGAMPNERWQWPHFIDVRGKHKGIEQGGFLERIDEFDAAFFRISPREAELMDPQQRLLLELSWEAIEDAGHRPLALCGRKVAVFVGVCHGDYRDVLTASLGSAEAHLGPGTAHAMLANRLSYFYDFSGPSLSIDTASSSSLVALHEAVVAIRRGECEQALVGAANLMCGGATSIAYYEAGMLSPTGTCRAFDEKADGYVRGEGAAMLWLKPLAMARDDGDSIYGVIRATAVNHGGQAASLTAPKPSAQAAVIEAAWAAADVPLESIGYIEAHGTGTSLGDPVEVGGLTEAFRRLSSSRGEAWPGHWRCGLGSVKPAIGHLEGAAGLAGVLKAALAIRHGEIPATLNFERLNPHIDLAGTCFHVVGQAESWPSPKDDRGRPLPRRAGVSSFGLGGANAHVVLEEYVPSETSRRPMPSPPSRVCVVVSARNADRLRDRVMQLLAVLRNGRVADGDLVDIAYTLQVGREPMEERLGLVVRSVRELEEALDAFVRGAECPGLYRGQTSRKDGVLTILAAESAFRGAVQAWIDDQRLEMLLELWVQGLELDWARLYGEARPRRIGLPTYPFARDRHWVTSQPDTVRTNATLHPLVHQNTSDLAAQRFTSRFTGNEFFLADHRIGGRRLLPAAAYLEMAREAVERSIERHGDDDAARVIGLKDLKWVRALVVNRDPLDVQVELHPADDDGEIQFEVYSRDAGTTVVYARGVATSAAGEAPRIDAATLARRYARGCHSAGECYAAFAALGIDYGEGHRAIEGLHVDGDEVVARLVLPASLSMNAYVVHPALLDAAVQAIVGFTLVPQTGGTTNFGLPFELQRAEMYGPCAGRMWAVVRRITSAGGGVASHDIDLCDEAGGISVRLVGLHMYPVDRFVIHPNDDRSSAPDGRSSSRAPSANQQHTAVASATDTLLATPEWRMEPLPAGAERAAAAVERHEVVVCGLPTLALDELAAALPDARCRRVAAAAGASVAAQYAEVAGACFETVTRLLGGRTERARRLQVVVGDTPAAAVGVGVAALLQTATEEQPLVRGQVLVVPAATAAAQLAAWLRAEAADGCREAVVRYDASGRAVRQWQPVAPGAAPAPPAFAEDSVYLITGGLGALGRIFATAILTQTQRSHVVLTGRGAATPARQAQMAALGGEPRVTYAAVELTDAAAVHALIAGIVARHGRLDGVLHLAGMIADNFILKKSRAEFDQVLAPKVLGTYHLDEASRDCALTFFALFSSVASVRGNAGQADYAAANGFLDGFASYRNQLVAAGARQGRTCAINWPWWEAGGMPLGAETRAALTAAMGAQPLATAMGLAVFARSVALASDQLLVLSGDVSRLRAWLDVAPARAVRPSVAAAEAPAALLASAEDYLRRRCAAVLKLPATAIDPHAALERYGIDSILVMQLTRQLEETFGPLAKTLFFEYQTLAELAGYFVRAHADRVATVVAAPVAAPPALAVRPGPPPRGRVSRARPSVGPPQAAEPIAIIGLSGRYPAAPDLAAYWAHLRDGDDCIVDVPPERWDWRAHYSADRTQPGRHYSKRGGFITGIDEFDARFFNISPKEAKTIDPQERLVLQHAWMALEDAGYTRASLQQLAEADDLPAQVSVYVGAMYMEYQLWGVEASARGRPLGLAGIAASIANRVSYALNLHGPSLTVDTMCSSSLSAIHLACLDLRHGRTSLALAGGVNLSIHPNKYLMLSAGQFISSDGYCQSFGAGGDGYIPGEGVGIVVLKRLAEAERDGDHIYAVLRGSALTHGGKTNGYTVPNPHAQASAVRRALVDAGVDARHLSYIEAHGTGTKLGDPIEIAALSQAFARHTPDKGFCAIGSVKSNIGHCEAAAGIAGLTKVLLQLQHQQLVPSLHAKPPNPHIDFAGSPFVVNETLRPWDRPVLDGRVVPRLAGVSSFGAGGSNAHLIVEEYTAPLSPAVSGSDEVVIPLSARTADQLHQKVQDLLAFVRAAETPIDLGALAYTLQVGREPMDERVGFTVRSVEQLVETLEAYVAGAPDGAGVQRGQVPPDGGTVATFRHDADLHQTITRWIAAQKFAPLLALWVQGLDVDWRQLYGDTHPRRVSLPTYPFARERHWIDPVADSQPSQPAPAPAPAPRVRAPIALSPPSAVEAIGVAALAVPRRAPITLAPVAAAAPARAAAAATAANRVDDAEAGVVTIDAAASGSDSPADVVINLRKKLERVRQDTAARVVVLRGLDRGLPRGRAACNAAVEHQLYRTLVTMPCPVIAVLEDDAIGASFLAAAICDGMVCREDATYGFTDAASRLYPTAAESRLFSERFGAMQAQHLLYVAPALTGAELRACGWTCAVLPAQDVAAYARRVSEQMASHAPTAPRLLKQELSRPFVGIVDALEKVEAAPSVFAPAGEINIPVGAASSSFHVESLADGVLVITIGGGDVATLLTAVGDMVERADGHRAIVLAGEGDEFLAGAAECSDEMVLAWQRVVGNAAVPLIVGVPGNAKGLAWLIAQSCDECVYSRTGTYAAADLADRSDLAPLATSLFSVRFGKSTALELLLTGAGCTGAELEARVGAVVVCEAEEVRARAIQLATEWAVRPRSMAAAWKQHTASAQAALRDWRPEKRAPVPLETAASSLPPEPTPIPLQSSVVTAIAHPDGTVEVRLEDRESKNLFSDALVAGLTEAFAHIARTPVYKVVVLTGYGNYFASGGTQETLLAVQAGQIDFTDRPLPQLPLDCPLPVIAAVQGHAIGAGWTLALFADLILLGAESHYLSPYLAYGFTPGAGATWLVADRLGYDIARESLLTAQDYTGHALQERGLRLPIVPRAAVYETALALARRISHATRQRAIELKRRMTDGLPARLDETYRRELAMHGQTLVGQPSTAARIRQEFERRQIPTSNVGDARGAGASAGARKAVGAVSTRLKTLLAAELLMREEQIDERTPFLDLGLDSISAVSWVRKINTAYHTAIEPTKVYSYPTLAQFSRYVAEESEPAVAAAAPGPQDEEDRTDTSAPAAPVLLQLAGRPAPVRESRRSERSSADSRDVSRVPTVTRAPAIAVVGMAGRFPKSPTLEAFWQNLAQGRDCVSEVAAERWDTQRWYQPGPVVRGKTNSRWMGALDGYDEFDPLFFNISPGEAECMDPQQRLFLQACWHAIEDAGYDARLLSGSKCGVFVGCAAGDYHHRSRAHELSAHGFTGNASSILPARIAYFLNLQGPCLAIDTACSSSLVALAEACDSLAAGHGDLALAGGVSVLAGPDLHIKAAQAGMLSPQGRCFTFDQRADGVVPAEGVGVVLLKRLADAERDRDMIHAVIRGWGVNQDGRTNGLTAPNAQSQARLIQDVHERFQIGSADITLVEAHGTGTALGDPIEVEGLKQAFRSGTRRAGHCELGSVKSNIGHCLTAAGIAGVLKLVLALEHEQLPPTINFERLNDHVDLTDSPFHINDRLEAWSPSAAGRLAAVNSFGFSGTNAHAVIGEYRPALERQASVRPAGRPFIVPLSARTSGQLRQKAEDMLAFLQRTPDVALDEVAYTLQVGRQSMDERIALVVTSVDELVAKLRSYVEGERRIDGLWQGRVTRAGDGLALVLEQAPDVTAALVSACIAGRKLPTLAQLWVTGIEIDWNALYGASAPRRLRLPLYPFARERYWIDAPPLDAAPGTPPAILHPLLHQNVSDLSAQRYRSTLTGTEFFLADHRVRLNGGPTQRVLPGVAYLEMARAAVRHASPNQPESPHLELHDIVWLKPLVVQEPKPVSISLIAGDDGEIEYQVSGLEDGNESVHCQGRARFDGRSELRTLDLVALKARMAGSSLAAPDVYTILAKMGLDYGPAHRGIVALHLGHGELLVELRVPAVVEATLPDYWLHPAVMDAALQASIGLAVESQRLPDKPFVPFALKSLRIVSTCTREMTAWVRHSEGSKQSFNTLEFDVDLCDMQGNVCVEVRGCVVRPVHGAESTDSGADTRPAGDEPGRVQADDEFDNIFYGRLLAAVANRDISVDQAAEVE